MIDVDDADEFTEPVTVPEGLDSHNTLAEFLLGIAQALANRTRNLKNRLDLIIDPALRGAFNTFTEPQLIDVPDPGTSLLTLNTPVADQSIIGTDQTPGDHPGTPANKWKYIGTFKRAGGQYVYMFTGRTESEGCFAVVCNAQWNVDTQEWNLRDTTKHGSALILTFDRIRFYVMGPASSPWADWGPTFDGTFEIAGIQCAVATAASFVASVAYTYDPVPEQTTALPLSNGIPTRDASSGNFAWNQDSNGEWSSVLANAVIRFPIRLPAGATLKRIDVLHATLGSANVIDFVKRAPNWAGKDAATVTPTAFGAPNTPEPFSVSQCSLSETIDPMNEYEVRFSAPTVGATVMNIRLVWDDPGPRNH